MHVKLPVVCLAAAFAGGVALGLYSPISNLAASIAVPRFLFVLASTLLVAGIILLRRNLVTPAAMASLSSWLALGLLAALGASRPLPANHVLNLIATSKIDISSPLRWHGHLRDEPASLPSGTSLDVALDSVEFEGTLIPVKGGMRVGYFQPTDSNLLPTLHAGDTVSFVAQARLPLQFRDEGAFDR